MSDFDRTRILVLQRLYIRLPILTMISIGLLSIFQRVFAFKQIHVVIQFSSFCFLQRVCFHLEWYGIIGRLRGVNDRVPLQPLHEVAPVVAHPRVAGVVFGLAQVEGFVSDAPPSGFGADFVFYFFFVFLAVDDAAAPHHVLIPLEGEVLHRHQFGFEDVRWLAGKQHFD